MKKFFYAVMMIAAMGLIGCDPDDPNKENEGGNSEPVDITTLSKLTLCDAQLQAVCMSPNKKYVAGMSLDEYKPAIWNVETGEIELIEGYDEGTVQVITNDGVAIIAPYGGNSYAVKYDHGKVTELYTEKGNLVTDEWGSFYDGEAGTGAWAIADNGTIVGFYFMSDYTTTPCVWQANGTRQALPVPTTEELGFEFSGAGARWISADGKTILGYLNDDFGTWPAIIWKNEGGQWKYNFIAAEYWEPDFNLGKPYMVFGTDAMALSANGKWLVLSLQAEYDPWDFSADIPETNIARINLETMQMEIISGVSACYCVSNDGTLLALAQDEMGGRTPYIVKAGSKELLAFKDAYKFAELNDLVSVTPSAIAADNSAIMAFGYDEAMMVYCFLIH